MRPKSPTLALANLAIAVLLLVLAVLGLNILNRISTHSELISTSLGGVAMNRRGFLQALFQGVAYLPLLPVVALAREPIQVIVQQSPIAGFQYYEGDNIFHLLRLNTPLQLKRDLKNTYDKNAVAIYAQGKKLGFVPRADNTAVAQMLDRNEKISARIVELTISENPWERVRFEVVLNG